jgi:hypothetical protein
LAAVFVWAAESQGFKRAYAEWPLEAARFQRVTMGGENTPVETSDQFARTLSLTW